MGRFDGDESVGQNEYVSQAAAAGATAGNPPTVYLAGETRLCPALTGQETLHPLGEFIRPTETPAGVASFIERENAQRRHDRKR